MPGSSFGQAATMHEQLHAATTQSTKQGATLPQKQVYITAAGTHVTALHAEQHKRAMHCCQ
jgi:hypothetical protein